MNTHGKYELPPLPEPDQYIWYSRGYVEKIRQEAIEADRKRIAKQLSAYESLVASLEAKCTHMRKMYDELKDRTNPDLLASERAANAILTAELEAYRKRGGSIVNNASASSEPVAVIRFERNKPGNENEMPKVISCNRLQDGDYQVFLALQPAETVNSDKRMLLELMEAFDIETWQCPSCGHAEDTATMDSAYMLRDYLKDATVSEPVEVPSDSAIMWEWANTPNTGDMRIDLVVFARALLARYG